jgi:hypothetical protein
MTPPSFLLLAALLQGAPGRPYSEERQLLDRHLAQLSRPLPDAPTPDEDAALLRQLASEAGLRGVEIGTPVITETGALGQSRRTLVATSTFPDADRFFRALQGSPRLVDVEGLTLRAADFGVRIEARLRLYHRAARAAPLAALDPSRMRDRTRGATREEAARFARDEQLVLEKTIALDDLRRRHTSPRMFLAETGASFRDAVAALNFGSLDGDTGRFTLRGVVAGLGAADALERRLEGGFFRLREFSRAPKDACYQFEAVGESYRAGPQAALPLPVDEPFRPADAFCQRDRDSSLAGLTGTILRASGSSDGGISLRAVDADLADVVAALENLSREPLVVAEEVRGRVNVDFARVSVDDALRALPVQTTRIGAVRLIHFAERPTENNDATDDTQTSARFSFRGKRARGEDVLASLAEAEPAYAALGPLSLPRISVFARDAPVGDIRRAVLLALRLVESREDNARVLRIPERSAEIGPIAASSGPRILFRARDLAVEEMGLVAVGRTGEESVAFVYSTLGELVALRSSDALADGVIAGVDANGLFIDTSEGPVRISLTLPAPPRSR